MNRLVAILGLLLSSCAGVATQYCPTQIIAPDNTQVCRVKMGLPWESPIYVVTENPGIHNFVYPPVTVNTSTVAGEITDKVSGIAKPTVGVAPAF